MSAHMTASEVSAATRRLLDIHGFTDWKVTFGGAHTEAGSATYVTKTVRFSRVLMKARTREGMMDTIRHEVAHVIAGHAAAHGPVWKRTYRELGGTGGAAWDPQSLLDPDAFYRWAYLCEECGTVLGRTGRKRDYRRFSTRCCGARVKVIRINTPVSRSELTSVAS